MPSENMGWERGKIRFEIYNFPDRSRCLGANVLKGLASRVKNTTKEAPESTLGNANKDTQKRYENSWGRLTSRLTASYFWVILQHGHHRSCDVGVLWRSEGWEGGGYGSHIAEYTSTSSGLQGEI